MKILSRCKKHGVYICNGICAFASAQWQRSAVGVMLLWCLAILCLSGLLDEWFDWLLMNNSERIVFIQTCSFLVPSILYMIKTRSKEAFFIRPIQRQQLLVVVLYSFVVAVGSLFLATLTTLILGDDSNVSYVSVVGGGTTQIGLFAGAVFPAVCEELLMRGAVLNELRPTRWMAPLLSGIFFAMLHGSIANFIGPMLAGWVYGMMTLHYASIIPAVVAHMVYNAYLLVLSQILMLFTGNDAIFFVYLVNVAILFCSIYGIIIYYEKNQQDTPLWQQVTQTKRMRPNGKWLKKNLLSWPFALFCILFAAKLAAGALLA